MTSQIEFLTLALRADGPVPVISEVIYDPSKSTGVMFQVGGEADEVQWAKRQIDAGEAIVRVGGKLYRLHAYFGIIDERRLDLNASLEPLSPKQ